MRKELMYRRFLDVQSVGGSAPHIPLPLEFICTCELLCISIP